ncbi:sugar MFS transporter [Ginsengibacter hankyongi]|uniref:Sugar MFS transporter n=1 Tax=Ginsengibacter hankyongi TaxID=2607284 RepID=A0A5J5IBQ9_9BACT|nr:sugar MFS transporter [Ginsengibacter hankyongi]KAA9034364.1 sugar MFS transporter [Ginsengibacter hankyongi]
MGKANYKDKKNYGAIAIIGLLFFIFGFVSWLNSLLIPYFKFVCNLATWQSMMVAFSFYFSYFVMAIPSSALLKKTGFKNGMTLGLLVMAAGTIIFIPAALGRNYITFLLGLFVQATGLTILQTAVNPYITILGPIESAAKRISIMGICNKAAGALAPLILIRAITKNPDEIDQLKKLLPSLKHTEQLGILNELSSRLIMPYVIMTIVLVGLGLMIRYSKLPEVKEQEEAFTGEEAVQKRHVFQYPFLVLGAIAIFFEVSVEVLAVDSIINYSEYMGYSFKEAKFFATYILLIMIISYIAGAIAIPKYIKQKKALQWSSLLGLILSLTAIFIAGKTSVWFIALLGLSNALLWPSIWPLAIEGLGKFTKRGSALMIMGVVGGAITPLVYGYLSDYYNPRQAYWILVPCYIFLLFFSVKGYKLGRSISKQVSREMTIVS